MSAISSLESLSRGLSGLLFPRFCPGCDAALPSDGLCEDCVRGLHRLQGPDCEICGQDYSGAFLGSFRCSNCAELNLQFDAAIAGYRSTGIAREMVHQLKYLRRLHLAPVLAKLLAETLCDDRLLGTDWVMVPVPLHRKRERWRRFNQAERLCCALQKTEQGARLPMVPALRRIRPTQQQIRLDRIDRLENLRDAFALSKRRRHCAAIEGKNILLVDDVLTTGATASECAAVLKQAGGVAKVVVITVVRG